MKKFFLASIVLTAVACQTPKKELVRDSKYSTDLSTAELGTHDEGEAPAPSPCGDADCAALTTGCNIGYCDKDSGTCKTAVAADSTPCDDGNACTGLDSCTAGVCAGTAFDCSPLDDVCNVGACDAATGECVPSPRPDTTTCDDGSACTSSDHCVSGTCGGTTIDCSGSMNACHAADCNPTTGCVAVPLTGVDCDDADPCTVNDTCTSGTCGGSTKDCSMFAGPCSTAACIPANGGCMVTQKPDNDPCSDGSLCTSNDKCVSGSCIGTPKTCPAGAQCQTPTCDDASGTCGLTALQNGATCSDGDSCTVGDHCQGGGCVGLPKVCDTDATDCSTSVCVGGACTTPAPRADCSTCGAQGDLVCSPDATCGPDTLLAAYDFESAPLDPRFGVTGATGWALVLGTGLSSDGSLKSGPIANNQASGVRLPIFSDGSAKVSFWTTVASAPAVNGVAPDALIVSVDGVEVRRLVGGTPWTRVEQPITSQGPSVVEILYVRGASGGTGSDAALVDNLQVTNEPVPFTFATLAPFQVTGPFAVTGGHAQATIGSNQTASLTLPLGFVRDVRVGFWLDPLLVGNDTLTVQVGSDPPTFTFDDTSTPSFWAVSVPPNAPSVHWTITGASGSTGSLVAIDDVTIVPTACP